MKRKHAGSGTAEEASSRSLKRHRAGQIRGLLSLSEELCFNCFSHLGYGDLLSLSESSRYLNRLADDNQLWKRLYAQHFLDRDLQDRSTTSRNKDATLPRKTYKELFRIGHNWSVGKARTTRLALRGSLLPSVPVISELEPDADDAALKAGPSSVSRHGKIARTKVAWHGQYYFIANKLASDDGLPAVEVYHISPVASEPKRVCSIVSSGPKGKESAGSLYITEIQLDALDQGKAGIRLAAFYSSGQFSIFRIMGTNTPQADITFVEEHFSSQTSSRSVVMARLHTPILVTTSTDCSVRFRHLAEELDKDTGKTGLRVTVSAPTMRTTLCLAPMTMRLIELPRPRLSKSKSRTAFQVSLAYATPYYPGDFTVGIQVFNIHVQPDAVHNSRHMVDIFARSALAVPPRVSQERQDKPGQAILNAIEHDGPYIVASRNDNTISVYEVIDDLDLDLDNADHAMSSPARMHRSSLKLQHVRTLFGHTASVDAVGILAGRCVSTGRDGVKVWQLPANVGDGENNDALNESRWRANTTIVERSRSSRYSDAEVAFDSKYRWVGLDDSRIVAVCDEGDNTDDSIIKVYHFE